MAKETANNGNGWICLHRAILDWQHWGEPNVVVVFLTLLLHANTRRKWWQGIRCERGETLVTIDTLRDETKLSKPTIIRILRLLEDSGEITRLRIDQKHTKTTIKKYSQYQDISAISGKAVLPQTLPQTLPKQQLNNNNNNIVVDNNCARTHEEIADDMFKSQITIERFCMNEGITVEQCRKLADEVLVEWSLVGETHKSEKETKRHLLDHIRKKAQALNVQRATIEERKAKFIAECRELIEQGFNRGEVAEFAKYYSQPTADGRLLFETYKGWNTLTRFQINQKRKSS